MNLNSRDKLILVVVLVIVIWIAGIISFIKPAIDDVKTAQNTLNAKEIELAEKKQQIEEDKNLKQDIRDAYNKAVDTGKVFYPKMVQHDAASEMQKLLDVNNDEKQDIINDMMSISSMSTATLSRYVYKPRDVVTKLDSIIATMDVADPNAAAAQATANSSLTAYNFSFTCTCKKSDAIQFMENVRTGDHKSMMITSFGCDSIGENKDDSEWKCNFAVTMFMIPELQDPDIVNAAIENGASVNAVDDIS